MMKRRSCNESSGALLESRINEESLKIKNLLENRNKNASKCLFDLLRLLKLMDLPAEAKNATNVASLITSTRISNIKEIRNLAEFLFKSLKVLLKEWMNGTEDFIAKKKRKIMLIDTNDLHLMQSHNKKGVVKHHACRINKFIKMRPKHDHQSLIR